jgi:hypothetical protein
MTAMSALADAFSGSSVNVSLWDTYTQGTGTIAEGGGVLGLTRPSYDNRAGIYSAAAYDLTGSHAYFEIVSPDAGSSSGSGGESGLVISDAQGDPNNGYGNALSFENAGGHLVAQFWQNGGPNTVGPSLPFDPVLHKWIRIRESAGELYWDTAPDAVTWTNYASETTAAIPQITALYASLHVFGGGSPGGTLEAANFNTPPTNYNGMLMSSMP